MPLSKHRDSDQVKQQTNNIILLIDFIAKNVTELVLEI